MKVATSRFLENLKMGLDTLRGNKLRSFLTIIGVVVGVITVMLISLLEGRPRVCQGAPRARTRRRR